MGEEHLDDNNESQNPNLSVKDLITIGDVIEKLKNIINDQDSVLIIAQLLLNKYLTFDKLKNKNASLDDDHLKSILEKLIDYDLVIEKEDKYSLSTYNLQLLFDTIYNIGRKNRLLRESSIASLFFFKALIDYEINMLMNVGQDDFEENYIPETTKYRYHSTAMVSKDIFTKYQKILAPIYDDFFKEARDYDEKANYQALNPYIMYFGFFYYPDLKKE